MAVITVQVPGMRCRRCVRSVTSRLRDLPGVVTVEANAATGELVVRGEVTERQVRDAVADVPLPSNGADPDCGRRTS
jgi:copper chaperone CopZ